MHGIVMLNLELAGQARLYGAVHFAHANRLFTGL